MRGKIAEKKGDRANSCLPDLTHSLKATSRHYESDLRQFTQFVAKEKQRFTLALVAEYFDSDEARSWAPRTWNKKRAAIKGAILDVLDELEDGFRYRGRVERFFRRTVGHIKVDELIDPDRIPSPEEVSRFIEALPEKFQLLCEVLVRTGLRISECLSLNLDRSKKRDDAIAFAIVGKNRKEREVFIPAFLVSKIRSVFESENVLFLNVSTGRAYSRKQVSRIFLKTGKLILGRNFSPHFCRHFFITRSLQLGVPIEKLSKFCGHSSIKTTVDQYYSSSLRKDEVPVLEDLLGKDFTEFTFLRP